MDLFEVTFNGDYENASYCYDDYDNDDNDDNNDDDSNDINDDDDNDDNNDGDDNYDNDDGNDKDNNDHNDDNDDGDDDNDNNDNDNNDDGDGDDDKDNNDNGNNDDDVRCRISPINDPDLVTAVLERDVITTGCISNATVRQTDAEVHVIQYTASSKDSNKIELFIQDYEKSGFEKPFIIILASDINVFWQVRLNKNPKELSQHTFIVSDGSGLRFAYKKLTSRPTIQKRDLLPFTSDDLMTLATKKFSVVTTFTSVQGGNPLTITVGKAQTLKKPSSSSLSTPCVLNSGLQTTLNVQGVSSEIKPVEGCLGKINHKELIYVIEVINPPNTREYSINVEINRSRHNFEKKLILVLKSQSEVHWHVYTTKIKAKVDIVANSPYVSLSGVKSDKLVQVRNEKLTETGLDLLKWVEFYIGKIEMYVVMNNSNRVQITLPEIEEKKEIKANRLRNSLTNALTTHCDTSSITVALLKSDLQLLGIKRSMLTLLDSSCTASENITHIYIRSYPNHCGTKRIHTQTGEEALSNTLVVHDNSVQIDDDIIEGSGRGRHRYNGDDDDYDSDVEIFSGSGDDDDYDSYMTNNVYHDDEDLSMRPMEANFMCTITEMRKPDVKVKLFDNILFLAPYTSPVKVDVPNSMIYLEALCLSDPLLKPTLVNCWFAPDFEVIESEKHYLIANGCPVDRSVSYLRNGSPQSERISFNLESYLKQGTSPFVKLICEVGICCIDRQCGRNMYPLCVDNSGDCHNEPRRHGSHSNTDIQNDIIVVESLYISQNTYTNKDNLDNPAVDTTGSNESKSGQRATSNDKDPVVIEGLDSGTVVGIAFAAFIIGAMMMGALWFIHTHSVKLFSSGPFKRNVGNRETPEHEVGYVETTPGSSVPIST
ncbi:Transforming growth factor [Mactra antiquata]